MSHAELLGGGLTIAAAIDLRSSSCKPYMRPALENWQNSPGRAQNSAKPRGGACQVNQRVTGFGPPNKCAIATASAQSIHIKPCLGCVRRNVGLFNGKSTCARLKNAWAIVHHECLCALITCATRSDDAGTHFDLFVHGNKNMSCVLSKF